MKKLMLSAFFSMGVCLVSFGQAPQQTVSYPYWTISKDVQRMTFKDKAYVPAKIVTGDLVKVSGKGVHALFVKRTTGTVGDESQQRQVKTNGTPSWVVSKGIARWQYEKRR